jgi:hypothetical protein
MKHEKAVERIFNTVPHVAPLCWKGKLANLLLIWVRSPVSVKEVNNAEEPGEKKADSAFSTHQALLQNSTVKCPASRKLTVLML